MGCGKVNLLRCLFNVMLTVSIICVPGTLAVDTVKCVVVGNESVGKSSLLVSLTTNHFPREHDPTVSDQYSTRMTVDGKRVNVNLWDTAGHENFDHLIPAAYRHTDVFVVCFSLVDPASFNDVQSKWLPKIRHLSPSTPIVLVGTKSDLRDDNATIQRLNRMHLHPITRQQGVNVARNIGAVYQECSALTQTGVLAVFQQAVRAAR